MNYVIDTESRLNYVMKYIMGRKRSKSAFHRSRFKPVLFLPWGGCKWTLVWRARSWILDCPRSLQHFRTSSSGMSQQNLLFGLKEPIVFLNLWKTRPVLNRFQEGSSNVIDYSVFNRFSDGTSTLQDCFWSTPKVCKIWELLISFWQYKKSKFAEPITLKCIFLENEQQFWHLKKYFFYYQNYSK